MNTLKRAKRIDDLGMIEIQGRKLCSEEAANLYVDLKLIDRWKLERFTDLEVIELIYTEFFGYLKSTTIQYRFKTTLSDII